MWRSHNNPQCMDVRVGDILKIAGYTDLYDYEVMVISKHPVRRSDPLRSGVGPKTFGLCTGCRWRK